MEFEIEAFSLVNFKRKAILRKLLILYYPLGLGGAKVIKLIVVFKLSKRPISSIIYLVVILTLLTLALKALKSLFPSRSIRLVILY